MQSQTQERVMPDGYDTRIPSKDVCVIGGAGFLGSHLVDRLVELGHNVLVVDNLMVGRRENINPKALFEWVDIRDSSQRLADLLLDHSITHVFHLAACPFVPGSITDPELFFETNALGTLKVLRACEIARSCNENFQRVLVYASAEEYGTRLDPIDEKTAISPQSVYGVSKVATDFLCQVRHRETGLPVIAARVFNNYGPRSSHEYVIPEIISQLSFQDGCEIPELALGNTSAYRDFTYCIDGANMAIDLMDNGTSGEIYNMGSGNGSTVINLVEQIAKLMGFKDWRVIVDGKKLRPWDIERLEVDTSKLFSTISYRPQTTFEDGLRETIEWFKANGNKWNY